MRVLIFIGLTLFLFSCSSKFSLQKRKYTKGYYFGMASKKNKPAQQTLTVNEAAGKHESVNAKVTAKETKTEKIISVRALEMVKQHKKSIEPAKIITATASKKTALSVLNNSKPVKALNHYQFRKEGSQLQQRHKPFDAFGSGMGILSVIGIISGIVSFIAFIIYLLFFLSALGLISSFTGALWVIGVIIIVAVAIGLVVLANSD